MINNFNDFKKNIPSEILEKDFQELFSPDENISDESEEIDDSSYDTSGELSSSLVENIENLNLDNEIDNNVNDFSLKELNSNNLELEELDLEENNTNN